MIPSSKMNQRTPKSIYDEKVHYAFYKTLTDPELRPVTLKCIRSIFYNFFFRQYKAALFKGNIPVSRVDHPLDSKIPFTPAWVTIYLDFVSYWVRVITFLLRVYRERAVQAVGDFLSSMGRLYAFAAEVYQKNLSTTERPFYITNPRFFIIHLADPHLMCIPSLHVMVAIRTYTKLAKIMQDLGDSELYSQQIEEIKQGALSITRAILFVKQHSINCIAASLYAMTHFDPELFPLEEAEDFVLGLFSGERYQDSIPSGNPARPSSAPPITILPEDLPAIQNHITLLYRRFLAEKENSKNWDEPLLKFLQEMPRKS